MPAPSPLLEQRDDGPAVSHGPLEQGYDGGPACRRCWSGGMTMAPPRSYGSGNYSSSGMTMDPCVAAVERPPKDIIDSSTIPYPSFRIAGAVGVVERERRRRPCGVG